MPSTRSADPETSHEAEGSIKKETVRFMYLAIEYLLKAYGPGTDTELRERYLAIKEENNWPPISESTIRARRSELVDKGSVTHSGEFAILASGRRSRVWKIVEQ